MHDLYLDEVLGKFIKGKMGELLSGKLLETLADQLGLSI
jgi:hypothetical protein